MLGDAAFLSGPTFFSIIPLRLQVFQFFFYIFAERYLAFKDATGSARNAVGVKLHAVFSIEIKIFTGKSHGVL